MRQKASSDLVQQMRQFIDLPPVREVIPRRPGESARWLIHDYPGPLCRWNYHPEFEIHLTRVGTGRFIIGDRIGRWKAGHLVLIGPNVPHHWINDPFDGQVLRNRDCVFQFRPEWLRATQEVLPELRELDPLLASAARGVQFSDAAAAIAAHHLEAIGSHTGVRRLHHVLSMFQAMLDDPAPQTLSGPAVRVPRDPRAERIVELVVDRLIDSPGAEIRLQDLADAVGMSESACSRFFVRAAGQTFTSLVRQLRLARAGQLLENTDDSVAKIASLSGYTNLSNFNRQFKEHYGSTPSSYRRHFNQH